MACLLENFSSFRPLEKASMLLCAAWLILAPVSGKFATTLRPVISLHPPWTKVFQGETVLLTCNELHFYAPGKTKRYRWYLGSKTCSETSENTLAVHITGQYRCQVQDSPLSNPVNLLFSSASIILQAPHSVFEGDMLVLRCKKKGKEKLTAVKYYWNGKIVSHLNKSMDLLIPQASSNNSGHYWCIASGSRSKNYVFRSSHVLIRIQELFPLPELKATASRPKEGSSVNLTCETQLPLERWDTLLHFTFFRDNGVILSDWSRSPELQIPTIWREDSASYSCEAKAVACKVHKRSLPLQIHVQRVPVSGVLMKTQPQGAQVVEGEKLVLVCSVAVGTGDITFSWHREGSGDSLGKKALRSKRAELEIQVGRASDAGGYFCRADNGHGPVQSVVVTPTVRGLGVTGHEFAKWLPRQAVEKDSTEDLEAQLLCTPDFSPAAHSSSSGQAAVPELGAAKPLSNNFSPGTPGKRSGLIAAGVAGGSLSILLLAMALLIYCWRQRNSGNGSLGDMSRSPPRPGPGQSPHPACPEPVELRVRDGNVNPREGDLVYSEIQITQLTEEKANHSRTPPEDQHVPVVYSEVKTQLKDDSAGKVSSKDEDAMEVYENVVLI